MDPLYVVEYGKERVAEFRGDVTNPEPWFLFAAPQKTNQGSLGSLLSTIKRFMERTYSKESRHVRS